MKKQTLSLILLLIATTLFGQEKVNVFYLEAGVGANSLLYSISDSDIKGVTGFNLNAGYCHFLSMRLAVRSGIGLQTTMSQCTLNFMTTEEATDSENDTYEFRTTFSGWTERQNAMFLEIPVCVEYSFPLKNKTTIITSAGGRIILPLSASYTVTDGSITTTGYYEEWDVEFSDIPEYGFSTYEERYTGDIDMKSSLALYAELAALFAMSDRINLYLGGYFYYGISNMTDSSTNNIYESDGTYYGVMNSNRTDKVSLLSFGLKAGIRIGLLP